ncbi:uncharacterized protein LOC121695536 isoform X3 [Alosa sapidissima]|uniref:uncharacterized protein LOC121695536 isoform X3 n=1 Tax=Alosa sapidissima TaxID=34773 RepID=UPI001C09C6FA|nr:uncharacterized protein LOC121695536 isoform X3 [Alosa sapidissima]
MSPLPSPNFVGTDTILGTCGTCRVSLSANETNPLLLPCLHSMCNNCIPPPDQGVAVCPVCGMLYSLQSVTPHPLFCNVASISSSQKCGGCESAAVEGWCVECGEALCVECVSAHRRVRMTRDHTIKTQMTSSGFARKTYCPIHKDEPYKLYCITCGQLTCRDCQLTLHRNHSFQFMGEVVSERRQKLEALVHRVKEQRAYTQRSIQDLEGRLLDLEDEMDGFKQNVKQALKEFRDILVQTAMKLMSDSKVMYTSEFDRLKRQQSVLQKLLERQAYLLAFSEKTLDRMDQIALLSCVNQVQQQLQTVLTQNPPPFAHMLQISLHVNKPEVQEALSRFGKVSWRLIPFACSKKNRPPKKAKETPPVPGQLVSLESLEPLCLLGPAEGAPAVPLITTRGCSVSSPTKVMVESTTSSPGCSEGKAGLDSVTSMECEPSSTVPDPVGKPSSPPESPPLVDTSGVTTRASMERLASWDERSRVTGISTVAPPGSSPTPSAIINPGGGSASEETSVVVVQDRPIKGRAEALPQDIAASSTASETCCFRRTESEAVESHEREQRESEAVESHERVQRESEAVESHESHEHVERESEAVESHESHEHVERESEAVESREHVQRESEAVESREHVQRESEAVESHEHVQRESEAVESRERVQRESEAVESRESRERVQRESEAVESREHVQRESEAVESHEHVQRESEAVETREHVEKQETRVPDVLVAQLCSSHTKTDTKHLEEEEEGSKCPIIIMNVEAAGAVLSGEESEYTEAVGSDEVTPGVGSCLQGAESKVTQSECPVMGSCEQGDESEHVRELESLGVTTERVQELESLHVTTEHVREVESLRVTTEHVREAESLRVTTEHVRECESLGVTTEHVRECESLGVTTEHLRELESLGVTTERVREFESHGVTTEHVQEVVSDCVITEHVQAAPPDVPVCPERDQSSMAPSGPSPLPAFPQTLCQERPTLRSFLKALNLTRSPGLVRNPAASASQGAGAAGHETDTINSYCCPLEEEDFDEEDDRIDVEMQDEEIYHLLPKKHWLPQVSVYHMPLPSISIGQPLPRFRLLQGEGSMEFLIQEIPEDNKSAECKTHAVQQRRCVVCHMEGMLYHCATCNRGYHKGCHIPPLITKISEGWVCGLCLDVSAEVRLQGGFEGGSCMNAQDQKICEYLLLSLWCSKYRPVLFMQNQEPASCSSGAVSIMLIRGRLLQKLAPPYRTPSEFVSDIWLLLDLLLKRAKWKAECEKQVKSLQMIFSRRLQRVIGHSLHQSLLRNPHRQRQRGRPRKQHKGLPEQGKERKEKKVERDDRVKVGRSGNTGKRKAGRKEKKRSQMQSQLRRQSQAQVQTQLQVQVRTQSLMRSQTQALTQSQTQMQMKSQSQLQVQIQTKLQSQMQTQLQIQTQSDAPRTSEVPSSGVLRFLLLEKDNGRTQTGTEVMRLQPHT